MNVKDILNTPFPFVDKIKDKILLSLFFGLFIYTFLILFQPFGIANIIFYKPLFILGYAIITFLIVFSSHLIYPVTPSFDKDNWNVKKMFIFIIIQILMIAIFNWFYTTTVGKDVIEQHNLIMFIFITFSVGVFPTLFFILLIERFLNYKNEQVANKLTSDIVNKSEEIQNNTIIIGNQKNKLSVNLSDLICIKAEGNYVQIYILEKNLMKKHLVRCSLSKIKQQLETYEKFKHCHRSFIVNTQYLIKITGNARNFNLHLNHINFSIPVSRSFPINSIKK